MPSENVPNGISIYSFVTKRIVDRVTYKVLLQVPQAWTVISPLYFVFNGPDDELQQLQDDEKVEENLSLVQAAPKFVSRKAKTNVLVPGVDCPVPPTSSVVDIQAQPSEEAITGQVSIETPVVNVVETQVIAQEGANAAASIPTMPAVRVPTIVAPVLPAAAPDIVATPVVVETQEGDQSPTSTRISTRNRKKSFKLRNVKRSFSPIIEGLLLSDDYEMKELFEQNAKSLAYTVVKSCGRRIRLVNSNRYQRRSELAKLSKYLRKISKKKRSADNPTMEQAKKRKDWPLFEAAIKAELDQLVQEGVFKVIPYSDMKKGTKSIGSMMVLTVKRTPDGKVDKYKARLVALGNQQTRDQYDWIKSPTARSSTVKLLMSIQAKTKARSCVMDVKGAYLKSKVDTSKEQIYVRLPDGTIAMLEKYLYGLKQAGYEWSETLSQTLISNGYKRSQYDPCLFYKKFSNGDFIIMATHVDDFYVISSQQKDIDELHSMLVGAFDEVTIKQNNMLAYLGMQVEKKGNDLVLSQPGYILKILERANIGEHEISKIPYTDNTKEVEGDHEPVDKTTYLEHIGMLNYLAVLTRPDLLYALSRCAQKCANPTVSDMKKVKRIFKYINGTRDHGLTFSQSKVIRLTCWVDASHIHYNDGKGHFGYAFSLGPEDGVFYARSQKMKIVTPAGSTESEYVALYEAATEIVFLRNLLEEIGFKQDSPTLVYEDNMSTIDMAHGKGNFHKQKHINVKYHFTRELVKQKVLQICYCKTEEMVADILTKGLSKSQLNYLVSLILNVK